MTAAEVATWPGRAGQRARGSTLTPHLLLLGVVIIWSANAVSIKVGVSHVQPLTFTAARFLLATVVIFAIALLRGRDSLKPPPLRYLVPAALTGIVLNQVSFTYGVYLSSAVDASLIMGLTPILSAAFLFLYMRRRPPKRQLVALGLGFAGVVVVVVAGTGGRLSGSVLGDLVCVGAPAGWAVYLIIAARAARVVEGVSFMAWTLLLSLVVLVPVGLVQSAHGADDWAAALWPLLYSSVLATALAYVAYFWALARLGVTRTAIYTYLQPALGALAAAVVLGESLGLVTGLGAVAILLAAYLGSWRRDSGKAVRP